MKWVSTSDVPTGSSVQHVVVTSYAGVSGGYQTMKVGNARATVVFSSPTAYVRGNAAALRRMFGFAVPSARHAAGRWVSWGAGDTGYASVSGGLTVRSIVTELGLRGDLHSTGVTSLAGRRVVGVQGSSPQGGTATLYIALDGPPLPVQLVIAGAQGGRGVIALEEWGAAALQSPKPHAALPVSTLR